MDFSTTPFKIFTDSKAVIADSIIVATGAVAKRLDFLGSGEGPGGFWNRGISACAVCDGAAPIFRNKPLAVIGGGDSAMEEATFLTKYGSIVYIIHGRNTFKASKIILRFKFYGTRWLWGHMGTKALIIGSWGVEREECAEWGGFGSQGIGIVLCDRAWASHQVLGWSAGTRF